MNEHGIQATDSAVCKCGTMLHRCQEFLQADLTRRVAELIYRSRNGPGNDYRAMAQAVLRSGLVVPHAPLKTWIAHHQAEGFCDKDHADALEDYIDCIQTGRDYDWDD